MFRSRCLASVLAIALAAVTTAFAHEPPNARVVSLSRRIAAAPERAELWIERAEAHRRNGHPQSAEADLDQAERLAPEHAAALRCRAALRRESGRLDEALTLANRAVDRAPADPAALLLRARIRADLGDREAADAGYAGAIARTPRPAPELYVEQARLHGAAPERALAVIGAGIERLDAPYALMAEALDLELRLGRHDDALARIDVLLAASERREQLLARRGDVLRAAGRELEAWAAYSEALDELATLPARRREAAASLALESRLRTALSAAQGPR